MKKWLEKNYKTLIIATFLIPIITVAIVSISHVTKWYGISNPVTWAVYLSIGIEIAALSALAAISANMGRKVYFPFAIVTLIQFIGNIFFAYSYIDVTSKLFKDWVDLVSPLVEFMGVDPNDFAGHKRFLAFFAGGMLPIISLSFLHMLVKFTEEDKIKNDKKEEPIDAKEIISEVSRVRLSEEELQKLEKHLNKKMEKEISPTPVDDKKLDLDTENKEWDDEIEQWDTTLNDGLADEYVPSFDEDFKQNEEEYIPTPEEEKQNFSTIEPSEGTEEKEFSTIEPKMENIFQEESEFDGFVPEPFATPEEVEEYKIDDLEKKKS